MNRRRKSGRDTGVPGDLDEEQAGEVEEHAAVAVDMESDSDSAGLDPQTPAPASESSGVFMEPLLPPDEAASTTIQQQSEVPNYPNMPQHPQQVTSIHSYGPHLSEGVVTEDTTNLDAADDADVAQSSLPEGYWENAVSPVSTGSDSLPSQSSPSSSRPSNTTAVADMSSSPTTSSAMATPDPAPSPGASTSTSHIQPQLQMPYYMSPHFSVPFTPGQPSFLVPGPYPSVSYVTRPGYTFGASGPFQAFQYPAPPPGQLGSYALRPYPTWGPYASGAVDANWVDANAQTQAQMQMQMQTQGHMRGKTQRKRGRAAASARGEDVLRIVLVQPKNFHLDPATTSAARADASTSTSGPVGSISNLCERPASLSVTDGSTVDVSRVTPLATPAHPEEQEASTVSIFL